MEDFEGCRRIWLGVLLETYTTLSDRPSTQEARHPHLPDEREKADCYRMVFYPEREPEVHLLGQLCGLTVAQIRRGAEIVLSREESCLDGMLHLDGIERYR